MVDVSKFAAEDALGYRVTITGKNIQVTEPLSNYILNKLSKVEHFRSKIMNVHILLEVNRVEQMVTIVAKFEHFKVKVSASSTDIYASMDEATKRLETKLYKWKDRIQDHNKKDISSIDMVVNVYRRPYNELEEINAEIEAQSSVSKVNALSPPKIIATDKRPLKTLTHQEAIMKMELSGDPFLVFKGEEDQRLKVIYKRNDGNYGIMLPE